MIYKFKKLPILILLTFSNLYSYDISNSNFLKQNLDLPFLISKLYDNTNNNEKIREKVIIKRLYDRYKKYFKYIPNTNNISKTNYSTPFYTLEIEKNKTNNKIRNIIFNKFNMLDKEKKEFKESIIEYGETFINNFILTQK